MNFHLTAICFAFKLLIVDFFSSEEKRSDLGEEASPTRPLSLARSCYFRSVSELLSLKSFSSSD